MSAVEGDCHSATSKIGAAPMKEPITGKTSKTPAMTPNTKAKGSPITVSTIVVIMLTKTILMATTS